MPTAEQGYQFRPVRFVPSDPPRRFALATVTHCSHRKYHTVLHSTARSTQTQRKNLCDITSAALPVYANLTARHLASSRPSAFLRPARLSPWLHWHSCQHLTHSCKPCQASQLSNLPSAINSPTQEDTLHKSVLPSSGFKLSLLTACTE